MGLQDIQFFVVVIVFSRIPRLWFALLLEKAKTVKHSYVV